MGDRRDTDEAPPARPGAAGLAAATVTLAAYLGLLLSAWLAGPLAFAVCAFVVTVGEVLLLSTAPLVRWALVRVTLPVPWRWALASTALLLLAARTGDRGDALAAGVVAATVVLAGVAALLEGSAEAVTFWRKSPVLARGLPLPGLSVPAAPMWLLRWRGDLLWPVQLVLAIGTALSLEGTLSVRAGRGTAWLAITIAVVVAALAAQAALTARRSGIRTRVPAAVQQAVSAYAPDVVLYYGGGTAARYQVEMWLPTLEQSRHRTLVVVRDRATWRQLGGTTLPVLCAPADTVLTSLDLGSVRAALFVANGASNIHLLRMGGMRTAFIGHGDSDKASSRNPFVKVYDEVWVAGPAGAARYAGADTAAVADQIHVVGRPQAAAAAAAAPAPETGAPLTVLYAPTWEGWGDEPHHSSIPHDGAAIVRTLLAIPGVRVVYRPHPLTGTRDSAMRKAHLEVVALLRAAGAPQEPPPVAPTSGQPAACDDVDAMTRSPQQARDQQAERLAAQGFWEAHPPATHRIAAGEWPGLQSCLDHTDLLVADISGVLSDWLGRDRPLAVTNPAGLPGDAFSDRYPSSSGGLVLGPGGEGLAEFVSGVARGQDPTAAGRSKARAELIGAENAGADGFERALDRITGTAPTGSA
jgi:hypothetical protein